VTAEVQEREARLGYLYVAAAAAGWALIGLFTRRLGEEGMRASEVAVWRALLGGACFAGQWAVVTRSQRTTPELGAVEQADPVGAHPVRGVWQEMWWPLAVFSFVGVTVFFASVPLAVEAGGITLAYVLLYTAPAWVALGAALFLREHLGPIDVGLVALTLLGAALISVSGGTNLTVSVSSVGWGLTAGITYASYYLLGRRLFDRLGAVTTYAICLPAGGLVLLLLVRPSWPGSSAWLLLAGLAIVSTWLPYLCLSAGLARVPSSRAIIVATLEPVLAAIIGATIYDERLGAVGLVGGVLVIVAATVSATRR
jgi:drug/metabolite transporter (DMT)-like permease